MTKTTTETSRPVDEIRAELAKAEAAEHARAQQAAEEQAAAELDEARRVWAGWRALDAGLAEEERQAGNEQESAGKAADLVALLEALSRANRARAARRAVRDRAAAALNLITTAQARAAREAAEPGHEDQAEARVRLNEPTPPPELRTYERDPWPAFIDALNKSADSDGYQRGEDLADTLAQAD